ncbi:MAG: hypothetical protein ACXWPI_14925 [Ktedonobacterales bacterium]
METVAEVADFIAGFVADVAGSWERAVETAPEGAPRHKVRLRGLGYGEVVCLLVAGDGAGVAGDIADFVAGMLAGEIGVRGGVS